MTLFKLKFTNQLGQRAFKVNTDSQFLIGLIDEDCKSSKICLFENGNEIKPSEEKFGGFTIFEMTAPSEACVKSLVAVTITPAKRTTMNILMNVVNSSISYIHWKSESKKIIPVEIVPKIGPDSTNEQIPTALCMYKEIARLESMIAGTPTAKDFADWLDNTGLRIRLEAKPAWQFRGCRFSDCCDDEEIHK